MTINYPYWNNDEVISSDKLNSMVQAIINGDPLAVKVSNATKNDVNQIISYLSSLYNSAKTNLNSATSTSDLDTAYTNMTALVSNKLGSYANDDTVDLYSTGIRASIITFLQAYDNMMSNDRFNNKNTDNTLGGRIDSEASARESVDNSINAKISGMQANGGGRNLLIGTSGDWVNKTGTGWLNATTANSNKTSVAEYHAGDKFTYSATIINKSNAPVRLELYRCDSNGTRLSGDSNRVWSDVLEPNSNIARRISCTIAIDANTWYVEHALIADGSSTSKTVQIKGEMFESGIVAHDWHPAPEDTNNAIENVNILANNNTDNISKITNNGGGRNLFVGSIPIDRNNLKGWSIDNGRIGTHAFLDDDATNMFVLNNATTKENFIWSPFVSLENGETYTLSYYSFATGNTADSGDVYAVLGNYSETQIIADAKKLSTTQAVRYVYTFTLHHPSGEYRFRFDNNGTKDDRLSSMYLGKPMLEKGTIAHDWQSAPEDIQSQIDNLNANKISSSNVNWNLLAKNSSNTYNYTSGSTITLPNNSSITVKDDRIIPHINLPVYITDYLPSTELNNLATMGEYDNLFVPSATMATLTTRPTNPDTNAPLTGDCFFSNHFALSGNTVRAFQKFYSCDYNYVFIRSYSSSSGWSNWSCLTPYA